MCDDIFEEFEKDGEVSEREWQKSVRQINKAGYREGLDRGKEEVLQEGFNLAFSVSSQQVYRIAEMRGKISAKLSSNLMKKGRLTDEQEFDLQDLLQDVVLLESELLQGAQINISDWVSDSCKVCHDNGNYDMESSRPVCGSDQSEIFIDLKRSESDIVSADRDPVTLTKGGGDKNCDETENSSAQSVDMNTDSSDKLNQALVDARLNSWTKKLESILLKT